MAFSKALVGPTKINQAITEAASRYGVSPDAMRVIAQIESGGNPYAKNPNSSAGGLFQFIDSTAKQYGLANKFDPYAAADAGARLARDNAASLRGVLGREPTTGELYLAHQQGAGGARKLLSNPNARAVDVVGADAVRLNGGRMDMTAGEFAQLWTRKADKLAGVETPDYSGGGGVGTLAGGEGSDDLSEIDAFLGITPPAQQAQAPILPAATVAEDYAATGALDLSEIDAFLGVAAPIPGAPVSQDPSMASEAMRGLGLGARNVAEGLAGTVGLAYDPIAATMNAGLGTNIAPLRDQVSGILTEAGIPEPQGIAERILGAIQQGAAGSIGMVGAGRAVGGLIGNMFASGPSAQVMGGGGSGGGAQIAAEAGAGPVGQAAAGFAGAVAGAAPTAIRRPQMSPTAADDVARAERAGITPMTSDVFQPKTFIGRSVQRIGELVPLIGTGPVRAAQQAARVAAVRDLARVFGADAQASDDVMKSFLQKRSDDLQKYSVLKNDVITSVPGKVDVTRTVAEIDGQVAKLRGLKTAEVQPVIAKLEDWKRAIQDQDLGNIELLRKQIGEAFEAPDLAAVRGTGKKALSAIYRPLKEDMGDHIKANGQPRDFTKWGVANARLSEMMGELDKTSLKSALSKGDQTPEAIRGLLFSQKPSDVKALYRALPPEGRARARGAILQEALVKASDGEALSPQKFRSQIVKMGGQIGVFFGGDDLKAVDGLRRVLDMTSRASETAAFGPTGVQTVPVVGGMALTDMAGGLGGGIASAGVLGLSARAMESKPVRNMLMKLAATAPGSKEELALVKRIMESSRATQATGEPQ